MRIENVIIKCELCDFVFDSKKYTEEWEKIIKPYAKESYEIFHLNYNNPDKQIEKSSALSKKYRKQFETLRQMFKPDTYQKDDNYFANFICKKCNHQKNGNQEKLKKEKIRIYGSFIPSISSAESLSRFNFLMLIIFLFSSFILNSILVYL